MGILELTCGSQETLVELFNVCELFSLQKISSLADELGILSRRLVR
jgi:hypothetical protein